MTTTDRLYERTARVRLADDEPRCEPLSHCAHRHHCARYMAAIPAQGGKVGAFAPDGNGLCKHYLSASAAAPAPPPAPPKRHWDDRDA